MNLALLQQAGQSPLPTLIMFGGMAVLFYFLLIRPQSKARKEMEARLAKIKAGDEVLLQGGLYATVEKVDEKDAKVIYLKLGGCVVKARRTAVVAFATEAVPEQN